MSSSNSINPQMFELIRRFHPTGNASSNQQLACDPSGFAEISDELKEAIEYPRPLFNWPGPALPENNYFVIEAMAKDVLMSSGFVRESRSLEQRLTYKRPVSLELANVLHHYLDFKPNELDETQEAQELKAKIAAAGYDVASMSALRRASVKNTLVHGKMKLQDEWDWLVQHAGITNAFGKTAACYLSPAAISTWSSQWLLDLIKPTLASPDLPTDPTAVQNAAITSTDTTEHTKDAPRSVKATSAPTAVYAHRAWFDQQFPMGWTHLDCLHETALISAPLSFHEQMTLLAYEIATKSLRGLSPAEVLRLSFDHFNSVEINGAALLGMKAFDYFTDCVGPALMNKSGSLHEKDNGALARFVKHLNPTMTSFSSAECAWHVYRTVVPTQAKVIEETWLSRTDPQQPRAAKVAAFEKMELLGATLRLVPEARDQTPQDPITATSTQTRRILKI